MIKEAITLDEVIDFFNELIEIDRDAVDNLFNSRVRCNEALARHPTVQVLIKGCDPVRHEVGIVGIINGLFGAYPDEPLKGWGPFGYNVDDKTGKLIKVGKTRDIIVTNR